VIGATIPGMPVVLGGRSDWLGWGLTASYLDDQDVYIEKLNPANPEEYLTPAGYRPFRTRDSVIPVKDRAPVTIQTRWTENGPVLPATQFNLGTITPQGHVTSVAWTLLSPADTSISSAMGLMRARSVEEAIATAEGFLAPSVNLILVEGDAIAMKTLGAAPVRLSSHQTQGRIPSLPTGVARKSLLPKPRCLAWYRCAPNMAASSP